MKIKPISGWGIATKDGHGKFRLSYAAQGTRRELFAKYPWTKNADGYLIVRITIKATPAQRTGDANG